MSKVLVAALYKFVALPDYEALQAPLQKACEQNHVMGTLLLAREGINGTVSGTPAAIDQLISWLRSDPRDPGVSFAGIERLEISEDDDADDEPVSKDPKQWCEFRSPMRVYEGASEVLRLGIAARLVREVG